MRILVVDDEQQKVASIVAVLVDAGCDNDRIEVVSSLVEAKTKLRARTPDLLVLDLRLPSRFGDPPPDAGGLELLRWMRRNRWAHSPRQIVAVTRYEVDAELAGQLEEYGLMQLRYQTHDDSWKRFLTGLVQRISASPPHAAAHESLDGSDPDAEQTVLVLTAVDVEREAACRILGATESLPTYGGRPWWRSTSERGVRFIVGQSADMGMLAAQVAAIAGVQGFAPSLVVMCGICAGVKERVGIGDIVVADPAWDAGSGKLSAPGLLHPDPRQLAIAARLQGSVDDLSAQDCLKSAYAEWHGDKPRSQPQVRRGPAASIAAVVTDPATVEQMKNHNRKLLGIDMEAYAVYFAVNALAPPGVLFLSAKAVVDFADGDKSDGNQRYGAAMSAEFVRQLAFHLFRGATL